MKSFFCQNYSMRDGVVPNPFPAASYTAPYILAEAIRNANQPIQQQFEMP